MPLWNIHQLNHLVKLLLSRVDIQTEGQQILATLFADHEVPPQITLSGSSMQQARQLILSVREAERVNPDEPTLVTLLSQIMGDVPDDLARSLWVDPTKVPYGYGGGQLAGLWSPNTGVAGSPATK